MIIGQQSLISIFANLIEANRLPRLLLLIGPKGQGKRTLARHIAWLLGADIIEAAEVKVDNVREAIEDSQALSRKRVYLFADAQDMTQQAQNALLKFTEEPSNNAYVIITAISESNLLPTIKSRGAAYRLEKYTSFELGHFTQHMTLLRMCSNPGEIERMGKINLDDLIGLCGKIVDNIGKISAANSFNIIKHVNEDDLDLLLPVLKWVISNKLFELGGHSRVVQEAMPLVEMLRVIYQYTPQIESKSINTRNSLEIMFVEMREKVRECSSQT